MDVSEFKLSKKDKISFEKAYNCLFNEKWYPKDFINPEFDFLYYLYPSIHIDKKDKIEIENDISVSDIAFLPKKGSDSYMNWNCFLLNLIEYYDETKVYFKSLDLMAYEGVEKYCVEKKDIIKIIENGEVKSFFDEISAWAMDGGFVLFGDSANWSYYSGDEFWYKEVSENRKYIEFDIFIFRANDRLSFLDIIKKNTDRKIEIENENDVASFFSNKKSPDRKIYKMNFLDC